MSAHLPDLMVESFLTSGRGSAAFALSTRLKELPLTRREGAWGSLAGAAGGPLGLALLNHAGTTNSCSRCRSVSLATDHSRVLSTLVKPCMDTFTRIDCRFLVTMKGTLERIPSPYPTAVQVCIRLHSLCIQADTLLSVKHLVLYTPLRIVVGLHPLCTTVLMPKSSD